jgi:hypothetical protein
MPPPCATVCEADVCVSCVCVQEAAKKAKEEADDILGDEDDDW